MNRNLLSQSLAEFIGTFFLVFFGCGAIILSEINTPSSIGSMIPLVFGLVVMVMIYATGHISGAHFNPAVSFAFFVIRKIDIKKLISFSIAQTLGACLASLIHKILFSNAHSFGATSMNSIGTPQGYLVEVLISFCLMFVIVAVATDSRARGELAGLAIGGAVAICAFVAGPLTGASMNPARSFAPALFSQQLSTFWPYLVFPMIGTALGALCYNRIKCQYDDSEGDHGCC